ncbi:MAG: hypothetical protein H7144_11365 [Burkholderiales bacterium]|nr:hypothetical protein [Phycisphaerae bacterium]
MALAAIPGGKFKVTIIKSLTRDAAVKTLERLFMGDTVTAGPIVQRSANFKAKPKRRGGRIWTKRPNKLHLDLVTGTSATIRATPQHVRDLGSVAEFIEVTKA